MTKIDNISPVPKRKNWQNFMELKLFPARGLTPEVSPLIHLIKYPIITEKTFVALFKNQQYTFDVDLRLSKPQIKKIFETLFSVNVIAINTHIPPRKNLRVGTTQGYRARYKRAILTLKEGQSLTFAPTTQKVRLRKMAPQTIN